MSSAQKAAARIKELNSMELNVGGTAAADGAEDCEYYGNEYPDVDIDL